MQPIFESKTLTFWLVLLAVAFAVIVFATAMQYLDVQVPYVSDFFQLIGLGGGAGTARNVVADHLAPAWTQAQEAKANGGIQLPPSMTGGEGSAG